MRDSGNAFCSLMQSCGVLFVRTRHNRTKTASRFSFQEVSSLGLFWLGLLSQVQAGSCFHLSGGAFASSQLYHTGVGLSEIKKVRVISPCRSEVKEQVWF